MDEVGVDKLKDYPRMTRWFDPRLLSRLLLQVVIAEVFGQYADRRLIHAALDDVSEEEFVARADLTAELKPDADGAVWLDYLADLGDGFDSTYAIASLLAAEKLAVEGASAPLPRAGALVMGGDEVYPTAERRNYKRRLIEPYGFALPDRETDQHPPVFMIPGNHDWYDGLTLFLAFFCRRKPTAIGNWRTRQRRSYFALRLTPSWWLWAIDIQLGRDMDQPQADYFSAIAEAMPAHANLILCCAEPGWYETDVKIPNAEARKKAKSFRVLSYAAWIAENAGKDLKVALALSGDTHHYSRYAAASGIQFVTSGGGGAFLHGTHGLREEIAAKWLREPKDKLSLQAHYPPRAASQRLLFGNFLFPLWNWDFSLVLAALYWLFAFALLARPGLDTQVILGLLLAGGFGGFFAYQERPQAGYAFLLSLVQAGAHLAAMIGLAAIFAAVNKDYLHAAPCSWPAFFWLLPLALVYGGIVGGVIFGAYLYFTSRFAGLNHNNAFSALRLDSHRHFLRMRIKDDTLTLYPVALDAVPRRQDWRTNPAAKADPTASKFVPATPLKPHLIEPPIVIQARHLPRAREAVVAKAPG